MLKGARFLVVSPLSRDQFAAGLDLLLGGLVRQAVGRDASASD